MLTLIDQIANRNHLQLFKAAVPYMPANQQKMLSGYIKLLEFQNVMRFFPEPSILLSCSDDQNPGTQRTENLTDMLNDMKNYCDDSEKKWLDQMTSLLTGMELYNVFSGGSLDE